jgi:hypothetical protein
LISIAALLTLLLALGLPGAAQDDSFTSYRQSDLTRITANVQRPNGFAWHDGMIYTACTGDSTIYEINGISGQTRTYIFGVTNAHTLHVEDSAASGLTLWVPDYAQNALLRVTRSGVQRIEGDLNGPWGIAYIDEEQFLVSNLLGGTLDVITRDGERQTLLNDLASPSGLVLTDDMLYLANTGSTRRAIEWYSRETLLEGGFDRESATAQNLVSGVQNVTGMQLAPDGMLYFSHAQGTRGVVGRVDPVACQEQGGCTLEDVEIVLFTDLAAPLAGLIITPDSRLYVHEMFSPDLYWLDLSAD